MDQEQAEESILDEGLVQEIEEGVKAAYNATLENLSGQIAELTVERNQLTAIVAQKERPTKAESLEVLTESCASETAEVTEWYDHVLLKVSAEDIELAGKNPDEYAKEKTKEYAKRKDIHDWQELLSMELKAFSESGECPVDPKDYVRTKAERDSLLQVITNAPENVKQIVESCLTAELKRKQESVDKYEEAEQAYSARLTNASNVQKAYNTSRKEQEERRQRIDGVAEELKLLSESEIGFMIRRRKDSVVVEVGANPNKESRFNKDMDELMETAAKSYPVEKIKSGSRVSYHITGGETADMERNLYNRLATMADSNFNKLGLRFNVCMVPYEK